uniref:non-specific serine/threonine protein kinase n=1 Tax=Cuerna arida TaxID=1464854 RepID=A0A1B6EU29_9HEMI
MNDDDSDWWSGLQTVSSFDNGLSSTVTCDSGDDVQQFCPSSLLVESLIGQLCKLIETEPKHQKQLYLKICKKLHQMKLIDESYELEEFESMRSYYQKALYHLVSVAKNSKSPDKKAMVPKTNSLVCLKADAILEWSRYSTEFEELDFIARGGFGQVFRARHKLDGELYAVKKIYLRYNNATGFMQSLTEVKMLAKLNHPNIVAYKAAWLEPIDPSQRSKHVFHNMNNHVIDSSSDRQDSSGGIVFETSDANESIISEVNDNLAIVKQKVSSDTISTWNSTPLPNCPQEWACLYIQMQLCHVTLRQWLDDRNHSFEPVKETHCLALFKKIVQGVEYIHSQGIVHHDIKPSNIFLSGDQQQVQVGDFGLACPLLAHNPEVAVIPSPSHFHRGQLGTKLYAAPEQLNGICTPKSDIFSLGIVLMELIQPFQTDMERSKVIGRLKTGNIPPELSDSFPTLVRVIKRCIYHSPGKRPTARELLELLEDEDNLNSARIIAEQHETIQRQEKEIRELKRLLSELSPSPTECFSPSSQFF